MDPKKLGQSYPIGRDDTHSFKNILFQVFVDKQLRVSTYLVGDNTAKLPYEREIDQMIKHLQALKAWGDENIFEYNAAREASLLSPSASRSQGVRTPISRPGFIYVIRSGRFYKIGKTSNPKTRIETYITENPNKVFVELCQKVDDYDRAEAVLHERFKEKRHSREWFKLEKEDLCCIKDFLSAK